MSRKRYRSPILMDLTPDDPEIDFGGSGGTSGLNNIFTFEDAALEAEIGGYDYLDLQDMDTDFDGEITWDEYREWAGIEP